MVLRTKATGGKKIERCPTKGRQGLGVSLNEKLYVIKKQARKKKPETPTWHWWN